MQRFIQVRISASSIAKDAEDFPSSHTHHSSCELQ